jgi:hypothetical protein
MSESTKSATTCDAVGLPVEREVRAPHPERSAFEQWCMVRWGGDRGALLIRDMPGSERLGEYVNGHVQFAWEAWQAARPKRAAVGTIVNVAAALAQRKPLGAFCELEDCTHIGHRQFGRAYSKADEATRLLAVKLADAARAL